jgi:hypothetical protein
MAGNNLPTTLIDQIKDLRLQLAELRKNKGLSSSSFRGEFQVLHANLGTWLLKVGLGAGGKYFFSLRRDDGTAAIELGTTGSGDQFWAGWDRAANVVLSDDAAAGQGLARPWLPHPVINVLSTEIPTTSSATYIAMQSSGQVIKQQPYAELEALVLSTGGGIGNARFTCNGSPIGSVMPVTSGLFAWQAIQTVALPGNYNDRVRLELEVQRTNGAGAVGGVFRCSMRQTP